ncbi:MAG TPA: alpha-ketoglutarate-dependent dioxygenase AlkB [Burkholderiales bacterium]|nr:alpha-ketoglutarate-dependent dioxygenase AlkB [Burkholderiales bacterium]
MPPLAQPGLFDAHEALPAGLEYRADFLSLEEEADLLARFSSLPFKAALFQQYVARRRVVRYGETEGSGNYGTAANDANPRRPFPPFLESIREKVAAWQRLRKDALCHALITEYRPGAPIGWHRDAPHFEQVVGISLAGPGRMRFRPYRSQSALRTAFTLELAPRSAYALTGDIRWRWEHHIPPLKELRYSITFRTRRLDESA